MPTLTCRASLKPSPSPDMEAKSAVVVVPMFEPSVKGYDLSIVMTPIPVNRLLNYYHIFIVLNFLMGSYSEDVITLVQYNPN